MLHPLDRRTTIDVTCYIKYICECNILHIIDHSKYDRYNRLHKNIDVDVTCCIQI